MLRHKSLDVAGFESPTSILFHLAGQWREVFDIYIAAPHGYHSIYLAVVAKGGASATAVGDVVNSCEAEISFEIGVFDDKALCCHLLWLDASHLPAQDVEVVVGLGFVEGKRKRTLEPGNGV